MKGKAVKIFLIGVAVVLAGWVVLFVVARYPQWKAERNVRKTVEALKQFEEEDYQRAMADTYGGKTPQETLAMFIEAVEAGDYELASKYFIGEKQEEWFQGLKTLSNVEEFLRVIRNSEFSSGELSVDKDKYLIHSPILISFQLYPNGIWKIIEI